MASALRARLAPLVNKVQQTVSPAYKSAEGAISKQYEQVMKGGEQYVVKDPAEADKLLKKLVYTNLHRWMLLPRSVIMELAFWRTSSSCRLV